MHNYNEAIKTLEIKLLQQKGGYVYIYNSDLKGEERVEALGEVKSKMLRLNGAIETLQFLNK